MPGGRRRAAGAGAGLSQPAGQDRGAVRRPAAASIRWHGSSRRSSARCSARPIVIENRGGAGASLGAAAVASAPPDGYTLLFGTGSTHGTNSSVYPKLSYDPVRDFVPVVQVTTSPLVLIVPPSLPAKSVEELIALGAQQARRTELRVLRHRQHQPSGRRTVQRHGQHQGEPHPVPGRGAGADRPDGRPGSVHLRRGRDLARLRAMPAISASSAPPVRSGRRSSRTSRPSPKRRCPASRRWSGSGCLRRPRRRPRRSI